MKLKYPEVSGRRRRRWGRAETTGEGVKVAGFRGGRLGAQRSILNCASFQYHGKTWS